MMTLSIQDLSAGSSRFPRPDERAELDCRSIAATSPFLVFLLSTQTLKRFLTKRSVERTEGTKRGKTFHLMSWQDTFKDRIKHFSIRDAVRRELGMRLSRKPSPDLRFRVKCRVLPGMRAESHRCRNDKVFIVIVDTND
jgi:hypothetical protein